MTENGFTEQQAEVLADEQVHLLNANLATQADIAGVQRDIAEVKSDLLKRKNCETFCTRNGSVLTVASKFSQMWAGNPVH